jgi:hypothetical protein
MNLEDKLRADFARTKATLPSGRLDYGAAIARAKWLRSISFVVAGVAAAVVVAGTIFTIGLFRTEPATPGLQPAGPQRTETKCARGAEPKPSPDGPCTEDVYPTGCPDGAECPDRPPKESRTAVPGGTTESFTPGQTSDGCSGAVDAHTGYEQEALPDAVNEVRRDIITRTWTCDYEGLEEIALFDDDPTFMFGVAARSPGGGPAAYWREQEEQDIGVLAALVWALEKRPALLEKEGRPDRYLWPDPKQVGSFAPVTVVIDERGDWQAYFTTEP